MSYFRNRINTGVIVDDIICDDEVLVDPHKMKCVTPSCSMRIDMITSSMARVFIGYMTIEMDHPYLKDACNNNLRIQKRVPKYEVGYACKACLSTLKLISENGETFSKDGRYEGRGKTMPKWGELQIIPENERNKILLPESERENRVDRKSYKYFMSGNKQGRVRQL